MAFDHLEEWSEDNLTPFLAKSPTHAWIALFTLGFSFVAIAVPSAYLIITTFLTGLLSFVSWKNMWVEFGFVTVLFRAFVCLGVAFGVWAGIGWSSSEHKSMHNRAKRDMESKANG